MALEEQLGPMKRQFKRGDLIDWKPGNRRPCEYADGSGHKFWESGPFRVVNPEGLVVKATRLPDYPEVTISDWSDWSDWFELEPFEKAAQEILDDQEI